MPAISVLLTGSTGEVGTYVSYFLARSGVIDHLYLLARNGQRVATTLHNARVIAMMEGHSINITHVECDIFNTDMTCEILNRIKPTLIINSAALLSLYPFFPFLRKRQDRMNFIAGFAHTLPKDMALLWPLMRAIKDATPQSLVVNLAAPDMGNAILKSLKLTPTVGAGTIDSTVQGLRLAIARRRGINPQELIIRMICHHALRRFPPDQVPFILRVSHKDEDITDAYDHGELIREAADVSGVETMTATVANNAAITASSSVTISHALLGDTVTMRHAAGVFGEIGGYPISLGRKKVNIVLPDGISMDDATHVNTEGMRMSGVHRIESNGTVTFTEREQYWIREGLGLNWKTMHLEDARSMSDELIMAYQRMKKEES